MEAVPVRRWAPRFVAMRWRHVFWLLPLVGLTAGTIFWLSFSPSVSGVIQIRPAAAISADTSRINSSACLTSDETLLAVDNALGLSTRWGTNRADTVATLRRMIRCEAVAGTALVNLVVEARTKPEALAILESVVDSAGKTSAAEIEADLTLKRNRVEALEAEAIDAGNQLAGSMRHHDLLHRPAGSPADATQSEDSDFLRNTFEIAHSALQAAKIELIAAEMHLKISQEPLTIHGAAKTSPITSAAERVAPFPLFVGVSCVSGLLASFPLAYLLELFFPRRRVISDEIPLPPHRSSSTDLSAM